MIPDNWRAEPKCGDLQPVQNLGCLDRRHARAIKRFVQIGPNRPSRIWLISHASLRRREVNPNRPVSASIEPAVTRAAVTP